MSAASRMMRRLFGAGVLAVAALAAVPAGAQMMQSPVCLDLQEQYVSLQERDGSRSGSGQRMLRMDQLSRQLSEAEAAARRGNCNRFLFFGPRASPQCPLINQTIGQLRQQIASLRRGAMGGTFLGSTESERSRLRDWMREYGCSVPGSGGLRTICVRRCDGYFFPISFSTGRDQMQRDEAVCQSMYGGAGDASIFAYHSSDDVANAVSIRGERYGNAWWAFLYRDHYSPTCASQLKEGLAWLGERALAANPPRPQASLASAVESQPARPMPMPRFRPTDRQQDPETIASRAGKLVFAPYVPVSERPSAAVAVAGSGMRMVGADYYAGLYDPTLPPVEVVEHRGPLGFDLIGAAMAAEADRTGAVATP